MKEIFIDKLEQENDITTERDRRTKKSKYGKKDQPRRILCKLLSYKDKVKVLQNCKKVKGSRIYINEDFCQATLQCRKELWKEVKQLRKEEDNIAYLQYRSIVVKIKTKYVKLTSFSCLKTKFHQDKTKVTPETNFESIFFNPFSTKECFVDNNHDPDVNFYHDVSMLDTNILRQTSLKQTLRNFLKTIFPS